MITNINLLPWREEKIKVNNNIFAAICVIFSTLIIGLAMFLNMGIRLVLDYTNKDINYIDGEISVYQTKIKEINGLKERKKILVDRLQVINSLQADRSKTVNMLNKLINSVPIGILLIEIKAQEKVLSISGKGQSNSRVATLMKNLETSKFFGDPKLKEIKSSDASDESLVIFEIEVNILG